MKTVTSTRIVLDKDERETRKTWGRDWPRMRRIAAKHGFVPILFGDWSGYHSGQWRVTQCQYLDPKEAENVKLKTIFYTDGTTMSVLIERLTIEQILAKKVRKVQGYNDLVSRAIRKGNETYQVGEDRE